MSDVEERRRWTAPQIVSLTIALMFLAGVAGWALAQDRAPGRGSADVGFLYDMILHHEQAQQIASLELSRGGRDEVKVFAREVLLFQSYEIGLMEAKLEEWGYARQDTPATAMAWMGMSVPVARMPGLATDGELDRLNDARGDDADALFLSLLIRHHQGGVHMASAAAKEAEDGDVVALAERITRNQELEITELEQTRVRLGLPEIPYDATG